MGMTTTVTAKDTTSAMEDIAAQLGENAVILSTRKIGNLVEMTASNARAAQSAVKKKSSKKNFNKIFQNQENISDTSNVLPLEKKMGELPKDNEKGIKITKNKKKTI